MSVGLFFVLFSLSLLLPTCSFSRQEFWEHNQEIPQKTEYCWYVVVVIDTKHTNRLSRRFFGFHSMSFLFLPPPLLASLSLPELEREKEDQEHQHQQHQHQRRDGDGGDHGNDGDERSNGGRKKTPGKLISKLFNALQEEKNGLYPSFIWIKLVMWLVQVVTIAVCHRPDEETGFVYLLVQKI